MDSNLREAEDIKLHPKQDEQGEEDGLSQIKS
jgi:hypothetical protein